ncbi:hypothetical protein VTO42DRAFT_7680 [Malbranchea cinnamomea]
MSSAIASERGREEGGFEEGGDLGHEESLFGTTDGYALLDLVREGKKEEKRPDGKLAQHSAGKQSGRDMEEKERRRTAGAGAGRVDPGRDNRTKSSLARPVSPKCDAESAMPVSTSEARQATHTRDPAGRRPLQQVVSPPTQTARALQRAFFGVNGTSRRLQQIEASPDEP